MRNLREEDAKEEIPVWVIECQEVLWNTLWPYPGLIRPEDDSLKNAPKRQVVRHCGGNG